MAKKLKGLKTELSLECRIVLDEEVRWIRNVIMRGEIDDSGHAMIFLRDITEAKEELARQQRVASDNASMGLLIQSMVRPVGRFVVLDLERDRYEFYSLQGEPVTSRRAPTTTSSRRWRASTRRWSLWTRSRP